MTTPKKGAKSAKTKPAWVRLTIRVLRATIIPILCVAALLAGLFIGYVRLGGGNMAEVFDYHTWKHLYDLVFADS
jgi:hypothetical protein